MASGGYETNQNQVSAILVSVIIPVLNEEKYIDKCLQSVLSQDFDHNRMEVLLVDGMSEDKTVEKIAEYSKQYPFIKVLKNPNKTIPYALNIGIKAAAGDYIVRLDAHSEYSDDYVSKCLEYLIKTGAENVGGPTVVRGKTDTQKVIAASYHSKFAMGGGKIHTENYEGYSDTVFLGSYKRDTIMKIGLYDERFSRNEDDELNFRINKSGGKVYINPEIKSVYYPRSDIKGLFKQHFEYGVWKVAVIKKHKKPARITHLVPLAFVLFLVLGLILSLISTTAAYIYLSVLLLYTLLNIYYSFTNKYVKGIKNKLLFFVVHFVLHVSYGFGFLCGIFKFLTINFD